MTTTGLNIEFELPEAQPERPTQALPSGLEQAAVVVTFFLIMYNLPMVWFRTEADGTIEGAIVIPLVQLSLLGLGVIRVAGLFDYWIRLFKLAPLTLLYALYAMSTMLWSADRAETIPNALLLIAITFYVGYLTIRFPLHRILQLFAVAFTIGAVVNFLFIFALPAYSISSEGLWDGIFQQKNALAWSAALAIPTLIVAARTSLVMRFVFYAAAALNIVLLLGSQSKTMLVAGIASISLLFVYRMFRGKQTLRGAVLVGLLGFGTFAVSFATANISFFAELLDKDVTLTGRIPLWESCLRLVADRPLSGYGYAAVFGGYGSPIHEVWIEHPWEPPTAHNDIVQILLELGFVGLTIYLMMFIAGFRRALSLVNAVPGAVGLWPLTFFSMILIVSITESGITADRAGWLMFLVATMSVATNLHASGRSKRSLA